MLVVPPARRTEMGKGGREIEMAMHFLAHAARNSRHPGGNIGRLAEALCEPAHIRSRWKIPCVGPAAGDAAKVYASMTRDTTSAI
jgi:hypothetical protein